MLNGENQSLKNQLAQLITSREMTIVKSMIGSKTPYINIIHRRPLRGVNGLTTSSMMITARTEAAANEVAKRDKIDDNNPLNPLGTWVYGPFSLYGMYPDPAPGAKRKWRLYAVYSDNPGSLGAGKVPFFTINMKTDNYFQSADNDPTKVFDMKFIFDTTCGSVGGPSRDRNSNMLEIPSAYPEPGHCRHLIAWMNGDTTGTGEGLCGGANATPTIQIYYLELQCLDVYE